MSAGGERWREPRHLVVAGLLALGVGGRWMSADRLQTLRRSLPAESAALTEVTTAGERVAASLLGGFRSILLTTLWVRATHLKNHHRFFELPLYYRAIRELQSRSPSMFWIEAESMALDIPRVLEGRGEERWRWIRRGLEALAEGHRRFPRDARLLARGGFIYLQCFDPLRRADDRRRYLSEIAPSGEDREPLARARKWLWAAVDIEGHEPIADLLLAEAIRRQYALLEAGPLDPPLAMSIDADALLGDTRRLLEHSRAVHGMGAELPLPESAGRVEDATEKGAAEKAARPR
jgi:hypothetical protein